MSAIWNWLCVNGGTVLVCALILGMMAGLILVMIRDKKKGKSCCGGCSGCAMRGSCHGSCSSKKDGGKP